MSAERVTTGSEPRRRPVAFVRLDGSPRWYPEYHSPNLEDPRIAEAVEVVESGHDEQTEEREVLSLIFVMLTGTEEPWRSMSYDERCARAANEAQQAFLRLEAGGETDG